MTKAARSPRVHLATAALSRRFVVHQAMPVYQMDYAEKAPPFKWAPAQTSLGPVQAVSNIAVCRGSYGQTAYELTFLKLWGTITWQYVCRGQQATTVVKQTLARLVVLDQIFSS
jgi:hypothetical protein